MTGSHFEWVGGGLREEPEIFVSGLAAKPPYKCRQGEGELHHFLIATWCDMYQAHMPEVRTKNDRFSRNGGKWPRLGAYPKTGCACSKTPFSQGYDLCNRGFRISSRGKRAIGRAFPFFKLYKLNIGWQVPPAKRLPLISRPFNPGLPKHRPGHPPVLNKANAVGERPRCWHNSAAPLGLKIELPTRLLLIIGSW
jgi:hypothetical protein